MRTIGARFCYACAVLVAPSCWREACLRVRLCHRFLCFVEVERGKKMKWIFVFLLWIGLAGMVVFVVWFLLGRSAYWWVGRVGLGERSVTQFGDGS